MEIAGLEQALVLILHKAGDHRGADGCLPVLTLTLVRMSTFPKNVVMAKLAQRLPSSMARGQRMLPPLVQQARAVARAASETRGRDAWERQGWWDRGTWGGHDWQGDGWRQP